MKRTMFLLLTLFCLVSVGYIDPEFLGNQRIAFGESRGQAIVQTDISSLKRTPHQYTSVPVEVQGRLRFIGRNYFLDPKFVLADEEGNEIPITPWAPLEIPPSPPDRKIDAYPMPKVMRDYVGRWITVRGVLREDFKYNEFKLVPYSAQCDWKSAIKGKADERKDVQVTESTISSLCPKAEKAPVGTRQALVLLVDFPDRPGQVSRDDFYQLMFGHKPLVAPKGSLADYYSEVSYLKFLMKGDVNKVDVAWIRLPSTAVDYAGGCYGIGRDNECQLNPELKNARQMVEDAVIKAVELGIDFGPYDNGKGEVDSLLVIHAGPGGEHTKIKNDIWSHQWWTINPIPTGSHNSDGKMIYVSKYTTEPEYLDSPGDMTIGVFAHEYGHVLGLPDLYDTDNDDTENPSNSYGIGNWSLMGTGLYNGTNGNTPAHLDAWSKYCLSWVNPIQVNGVMTGASFGFAESNPDVYKMLNGSPQAQAGEYFLIENRQQVQFDEGLPGAGLLMWHIDESQSSNRNRWYPGCTTCTGNYGVALVQADNQWELEKYSNPGNNGDPFPGTCLQVFHCNRSFDATTTPNSNLNLYGLYGGQPSGASVTSISDSDSFMTANLSASAADNNPPTNVSITAPTAAQAIASTFTLLAIARDDSGTIQKVEFYVDSDTTPACTDATARSSGSTFQCGWNTTSKSNGSHVAKAKACDPTGNSALSASVPFTIDNPPTQITTATTRAATDVTVNSATFNGTVNPGGLATTAYFQWGTSTAYGTTTPPQLIGSGTGDVEVSWNQSGLSSGTTYHYRVVANNAGGILNGLDETFTPGTIRTSTALDGFDPGANGSVYALAVQSDGKILVGGYFTMLGGGGTGTTPRNKIGRLNPDGSLDTSFDPGANGSVFALALQPDGKILVGGYFTMLGGGGAGTTPRNKIGRLNPDGSLDTSFDPGADIDVHTLAVQPDGKVLVGGYFQRLGGGGTGTTPRQMIGRLNPDGSLDTSFNPGANSQVYAMVVQPDGKILVGGAFTQLGGGGAGTTPRNRIGRLNPDGSLDTSFDPGANSGVETLAVQPDGKILVGGTFTTLGGGGAGMTTRNRIGRLNPDGSLDSSFNPGGNGNVYALTVQPDGRILVGGFFTTLGGGGSGTTLRYSIGRLNSDGSLDNDFNPGAYGDVYAMVVQPDGKTLVGGAFTQLGGGGSGTTPRNRIGRLNPDGSLDTNIDPGANDQIFALAVQADGKILVGGYFTTLGGGGTGTTSRNRIGRLNPDGSLDTSFDPGANNDVYTLAVQPGGKILVGGYFTTLGGGGTGTTSRNRIGRLNPDGSLDTSFDPGANGTVWALAVQPDGKILVGGYFTTLGGGGTGTVPRNNIGRLNPDGSLDTSFNPGANGDVLALALQADGKILVGGYFTALGGGGTGTTPRNSIGRLNPDGSLDTSFDPGANIGVFALAVQADGKILVGGGFFTLGGGGTGTTPRRRIGRLNPDGSLDTSFDPGANSAVLALALQADGKILAGGYFTTLGGGGTGTTPRNMIGRLNPDGSLDTSFNPGANGDVLALALQADGKILVGGYFTALGGGGTGTTSRNNIGRLSNNEAAFQSLGVDKTGSVITWLRTGAEPEVESVTFESSDDGISYSPLGVGARVSGGWQLSGVTLPGYQNICLRARGFFGTGYFNGSGSIVESVQLVFLPPASNAVMMNPAPGSTLTSSSVTFAWSPGIEATEYYLQVGTTLGGQELYSVSEGTNLSATVMGLPTNGSTVYVRLWSKIAGMWSFNEYAYVSCTSCTATKAAMTTPAAGSTLSSSMTTFWWSASLGSECYLQVGTTLGGQELYSAGQGTNLSVQVPTLPTDGSPVYARLWTNIGGVWLYNDYTYMACSGCTATKAVMTSPLSGSALTASSVTFTWSGSLASQYYLQVGTVPGGQQIYSAGQGTNLSTQVAGLPIGGGNVYARLWSEVSGAWLYNDYSYVACSGCTRTLAVMTTPAPGSTLSSTLVSFAWGSSLASECYLQVGTTVGGQEIYSAGEGTNLSSQVMDLPNNGGAVYVRLWSKIGGAWLFNDYNYSACTGCTATKAAMVTPASGSTLSSRAVTFTWSASLAAEYYLFVGTTAGGQEIYSAGQGTNLSVEVGGLPNSGSTVRVRLWSRIGGAWLFNDYTYTACTGCQ